jgi:uncharacterized BrkB/YihY/UPF0761 family membrane protein
MGLAKTFGDLADVVFALVFGVGLALFVAGEFVIALPAGQANEAINGMITSVATALTTYLPPVLAVVFIMLIYVVVQNARKKTKE